MIDRAAGSPRAATGRAAGTETTPAIAAQDVSFAWGSTPLFRGVTLRLAAGEMAAMIGPNGSGKTTLLRILSGALRPRSGRVMLEGRPVGAYGARERARRLAVVPQESAMTFDFTVMETVLMGRTPHLGLFGVEGPEDLRAACDALDRTGMRAFAGRPLSHLSGGERQLVLIARALAQRPRVLLLDEPTTWLDIRHRQEIHALLTRLNREDGLTILTTSHDLNLAARWCRRIVLIDRGAVRADGPPSEVFDAEVLSRVYGTPLRVTTDPGTGIPWAVPDDAAGH